MACLVRERLRGRTLFLATTEMMGPAGAVAVPMLQADQGCKPTWTRHPFEAESG